MARNKVTTKIPDATPIPVDDVFSLGSEMMGRLTGNAATQEAKLKLYLDDEEEDGFERLAVRDMGALETLSLHLIRFIEQMKSRGHH